MARQLNAGKPLKLSLSGLISPSTIDYIIQGLKGNTQVKELNVSNCSLEDADLSKLCEKLKSDKCLEVIKLQKNRITSLQPLVDMVLAQPGRGDHLKELDL